LRRSSWRAARIARRARSRRSLRRPGCLCRPCAPPAATAVALPRLRRGFDAGQIAASVAEATARLPAEHQALLERGLAAGERLTLAAVRDAARGQAQASGEQLPDALLADRAVAWQTTVRAIQALPPAEQDSPLAQALAEAVAQCERA
jgi:hypothetical protein